MIYDDSVPNETKSAPPVYRHHTDGYYWIMLNDVLILFSMHDNGERSHCYLASYVKKLLERGRLRTLTFIVFQIQESLSAPKERIESIFIFTILAL